MVKCPLYSPHEKQLEYSFRSNYSITKRYFFSLSHFMHESFILLETEISVEKKNYFFDPPTHILFRVCLLNCKSTWFCLIWFSPKMQERFQVIFFKHIQKCVLIEGVSEIVITCKDIRLIETPCMKVLCTSIFGL